MANDLRNASFRISDLRDAQLGDASLENLLSALTGKMQAATRLAVFAYEAGNEGHSALAATFRDLAAVERQSFQALLSSLHRHLDEMAVPIEAEEVAGR